MKNVVVALDFSDALAPVLAQAETTARAFGASMRLLHVLEPQPSYSAYGFTTEEFPALQSYQQEATAMAERKLKDLAAELAERGIQAETQLVVGNPSTEICQVVENLEDPCLVVGTHGHNLVGSILLGSVAESLVRRAVVPTLVVPVAEKG